MRIDVGIAAPIGLLLLPAHANLVASVSAATLDSQRDALLNVGALAAPNIVEATPHPPATYQGPATQDDTASAHSK